jgi:predicted component of type VI protein secretion system
MAAPGTAERLVTVSVLDRLLDDEPGVTHEPVPTRSQSLRMLKSSLRRDIEWLLNAHAGRSAARRRFRAEAISLQLWASGRAIARSALGE